MRFSAGALSIVLILYTRGVFAPWCGFNGNYGQPSLSLCNRVRDLDFPPRDDTWRIFAPEANWVTGHPFGFPKVPTPVQHQRVVMNVGGCAIAVYNLRSGLGDIESLVVENWRRVLEAVDHILETCLPYGGSQHPIDGMTSGLMIYVYEPGADIEINFSTNSVGIETANGDSSIADSEEEAVADVLRSFGPAIMASTSQTPPNSPQTTYCMAKSSIFTCVQHTLKTSVLFGNALSTFDVVSTYA
ncbi:MAG: hypothetical protein M1812_004050 [Candelaria pacifica]|nr:MAG: hypothetical protein M1812_004050 [Candelaria pacifica]